MAAIILQEIDDPTYMPTDAETREYARWLGMDEKEVRGGGGIASHHIPHTCAIMLTLSCRFPPTTLRRHSQPSWGSHQAPGGASGRSVDRSKLGRASSSSTG